MQKYFLFTVALLALIGFAATVQADVGAGSDPAKPITAEPFPITNGEVGSPGDPRQVFYDPNAGPWQKTFIVANGSQIIREFLHVNADPAWTNWEEQIVAPTNFQFGGGSLAYGPDFDPLHQTFVQGVLSNNNTMISFFFPPAPFCTMIEIQKDVHWVGGDPIPQNVPVVIDQWPTVPEPGTFVLLAAGLLGLALGYCWRRR